MTYPGRKGSKLELLWDRLLRGPISAKDIVFRLKLINHTKAISRLRAKAKDRGGNLIAHRDPDHRNWYTYELTVKD
jgi:hypothetical protein